MSADVSTSSSTIGSDTRLVERLEKMTLSIATLAIETGVRREERDKLLRVVVCGI